MKTAASNLEAAVLRYAPMCAVYWTAIWWPCAMRFALWNVRVGTFVSTIILSLHTENVLAVLKLPMHFYSCILDGNTSVCIFRKYQFLDFGVIRDILVLTFK